MADVIVEQALKAVQGLVAGNDSPMPVITEKNHSPASNGGRNIPVGSGGNLVVSAKGTGYMGIDDEPAGSALNPIAARPVLEDPPRVLVAEVHDLQARVGEHRLPRPVG